MKKTLLFLALAFVIAAGAFAYRAYNKPHRNTHHEEPAYTLQAAELFAEYEKDEAAANRRYLDKLLLVKGSLSAVSHATDSTSSISLATDDNLFGINCQLLPEEAQKLKDLKEGDPVQVKGICTGKLLDVVLVRGVIVK